MRDFPRDAAVDSTLALYSEGYRFISNRCERLNSDLFQTRLLLRKAICMRGEQAARLFYDKDKFIRHNALPRRALKSFLGEGGVQTLDGDAHRHRKSMFMNLLSPERTKRLLAEMSDCWRQYLAKWEHREHVSLFDEVSEMLCRAVCNWAYVPVSPTDLKLRTNDFQAMIDSPAALGPRHWRGKRARARAEKWIGELIDDVRRQGLNGDNGNALHAVAWFRDLNGELLDRRVAAVELINFLRPTVAVALYVTFLAHALHENPDVIGKLRDESYAEMFVHEVRRLYPFFPAVAALARTDFEWNGYRFREGTWVLLDLYGTNHDPKIWRNPQRFEPERFINHESSNYDLIPQGGGDHYQHHRCAGEWITVQLMKQALHFLTRTISYEVPPQDLTINLSRVPAIPRSRFLIRRVTMLSARHAA